MWSISLYAWWLKNVFKGDMPQLTVRSAATGMFLGGFLSLTNLYIGARTGWSLGVGITSVILSFSLFKVLSKVRLAKEMTVLENNAMQSIATSAGYMNSALVTSFAAYTMVTQQIIPMHRVIIWLFVVAILGVLFALPMKKRFINDEQLPFPEGMAAERLGGVVNFPIRPGERPGATRRRTARARRARASRPAALCSARACTLAPATQAPRSSGGRGRCDGRRQFFALTKRRTSNEIEIGAARAKRCCLKRGS